MIHIHPIFAGLQYRGDRLSGKPNRVAYKRAESQGVKGAKVTKEVLQELTVRYGFGPVLDITQVQAGRGDLKAGIRVAKYLAKCLRKHEEIDHWLPRGAQLVTNSRSTYSWVPGETRIQVRQERIANALAFSQGAGPAPKDRAGAGPDEVGSS